MLLALVAVGVSVGVGLRSNFKQQNFFRAEQVAARWAASERAGGPPNPIPASRGVPFVQLVDVHGKVVASSAQAANRRPLSGYRPPPTDRLHKRLECPPRDRCLLLMADRVTPAPDSPVVYAGLVEPPVLAGHRLEAIIAAAAFLTVLPAAWMTWWAVGRTLRPIAAIRTALATINVNDLSTRVPDPPGEDEIAQLARTVNATLGRLEQARERKDRALDRQRQFAADASHELRSPLAGVRVRLEEAQMHPDDTDMAKLFEHALGDLDRVQTIVTDLLLLARLGVNAQRAQERINLTALVEAEVARRTDGQAIRLHLAPEVTVHAVPPQITRVLTNLLDNARRHARHTVRVDLRRAGDSAELAVSDDGKGVAPVDRERIFERFVRLDAARSRDQGGTGLGLAIARDIAHAHHGTLHVEDAALGGASFVLRLPLA